MSARDATERDRCLAEARECAPLDAAVRLIRYHYRVHTPGQPALTLAEVFPTLPPSGIPALQARAWAMWQQAMAVAEAHYGYPGATRSADDERARLAQDHPGFGVESYGLAIHDALIALR